MASTFYFNLKKAAIWQAVFWDRYPLFRFAKPLKKLFFILFVFTFLFFLYGFFADFNNQNLAFLLGLLVIFLVIAVFFWLQENFFNTKIKNPPFGKNRENLAEWLGLETAKAAAKAINFAKSRDLGQIDSSILFYFLLADNPKLDFVFWRAGIGREEIKNLLKSQFDSLPKETFKENYSQDFQETILEALKISQGKGHLRVEIGDTISALAKHSPLFKKILIEVKLKAEDIESLTEWLEFLETKFKESKKFWTYENLLKKGSLAKEWTAGYTLTLDQFSTDWTESIKRNLPETVGHRQEIEAIERILSRREANNVLLVGEPGKGRKSIVFALAKRSLLGQSTAQVNYKRVVALDMPQLISQLPSLDQVEMTLDKILKEALLAGNVILVIDEFHNYIGQIQKAGVVDISGVILPYLQLPNFQIIAITTYEGLHKNIEQNSSILSLLGKVEVSEISERETLQLLENLALLLEQRYKKFISYAALKEIISLTGKFMPALHFPEKAMDILDEAMAYLANSTKEKVLLPSHITKIITEKTKIPVGEIKIKERDILLNLEPLIHERIINQEEAVREVASAMRRARADITIRKGPMGVFLFLGPTGVGKTETSKALAEFYFGGEDKMIRLDMSEFQAISDIPRMLGGTGQEGLLTTPVIERPFSLLLLDEIEKAHSNVLNLFLQVFDEGNLTDGQGRKVDFKNTIIIATSNAGYQIILEAIKKEKQMPEIKETLLDYLFQRAIFRPEFINRFDGVVVFRGLTRQNLIDIAELMLQKLKKNLKEKEIDFTITSGLKEKLVELGYSPVFGAREMRRVIQDKIENVIAQALLKGDLIRGSQFEIDSESFKLIIN